MIRKSHLLLALALVAAAVAAPIAQSSSAPKVDPLAVGYLIGQGLSPSEVTSWTTGACSHQVKAASCYAMFQRTAPKVDPLAVSYLMGQGLSPSQVQSWTVGACSHGTRRRPYRCRRPTSRRSPGCATTPSRSARARAWSRRWF